MSLTKGDYRSYITSAEWRNKHSYFLKRSRYRCSFFPFILAGKKARYNVHHMNYDNLGDEELWVDVIVGESVRPQFHLAWLTQWLSSAFSAEVLPQ
jgi:hypothetical protein